MSDTELQSYSSPPAHSTIQHDYILVDGSGSMQPKWWETCDAIEAYITGLKAANVNSHIILSTFDSFCIDDTQRSTDLDGWISLRQEPIGAGWGSTPLYDAINIMANKLKDLNPPRCSIVIVTDGGENASRYTDVHQAKAFLDWCRAKGWQVTFIGADFSNASQAALLGGSPASAIGVQKAHLIEATTSLAKKRARYGLTGAPMHWSDDEKQQFGGYLNAPPK
jgi:hypothetical protein